jgi:hypothetical protein
MSDSRERPAPFLSYRLGVPMIEPSDHLCVKVAQHVHNYARTLTGSDCPWESLSSVTQRTKLRQVAHVINHADITPAEQHAEWHRAQLERGWTYGPGYDPEERTDPHCLPYEQLPLQQRINEAMYRAIILAVFETLNPS